MTRPREMRDILGSESGRDVYDRRNMKMSLKGVDKSQNNANTIEEKEKGEDGEMEDGD